MWKNAAEISNKAVKSRILGFSFDVEPVRTEVAAVSNVLSQFQVALETGMIDPASKLPEMNKQLKAAGIEKINAEKQKQLDAWAANKK